jgi:hypothetical protein
VPPAMPTSHTNQVERLHLAESNLDLIAVSLAKAVAAGADRDEVVVLLLDTRDHLARDLAAAIIERQGGLDLDQEEARVLGKGEIPTAISVLPLRLVELLLQQSHPAISSGVRRAPPPGRLRGGCRGGWRSDVAALAGYRVDRPQGVMPGR